MSWNESHFCPIFQGWRENTMRENKIIWIDTVFHKLINDSVVYTLITKLLRARSSNVYTMIPKIWLTFDFVHFFASKLEGKYEIFKYL